jgi:hypothetical protein
MKTSVSVCKKFKSVSANMDIKSFVSYFLQGRKEFCVKKNVKCVRNSYWVGSIFYYTPMTLFVETV